MQRVRPMHAKPPFLRGTTFAQWSLLSCVPAHHSLRIEAALGQEQECPIVLAIAAFDTAVVVQPRSYPCSSNDNEESRQPMRSTRDRNVQSTVVSRQSAG